MAITSIDLKGNPWMVCDPQDDHEIDDFVGKTGFDPADVTTRPATDREAAKLIADKILRANNLEEPEGLFGVSL